MIEMSAKCQSFCHNPYVNKTIPYGLLSPVSGILLIKLAWAG